MHILMLTKFESVITLLIGILLIVFRKKIVNYNSKYILGKTKPAEKRQFEELKMMGGNNILIKIAEISLLVAGLFAIYISLRDFLRLIGQ